MTFQEAYALAQEIEHSGTHLVVAIGRFEMISDLIAHPGSYAWCVSAVSRITPEGQRPAPAVLRRQSDWTNLRDLDTVPSAPAVIPPSVPVLPSPTPPPPATVRRDDHITRQPMLF